MNQATSKMNGDDAALQVDFSENASLMNQNEVQSAHWCHGQATVITACVWICEHITDELQHTKLNVFTFMDGFEDQVSSNQEAFNILWWSKLTV